MGMKQFLIIVKKLKNKKRNANGLEIILQVQAYLPEIVSLL